MSYFLISNNGGDTTVKKIDPEKFLKELRDGDLGEDLNIIDHLQYDTDINYFGEDMVLVIKGEVVCPKPIAIKTVTKYEF